MQPLIDSDVLLYEVGACGHYLDEQTQEPCIRSFEFVKELMDKKIEEICTAVGATVKPRLFLTGAGNFREAIAIKKGYKANRKDVKRPFHYDNLKQYLIEHYDAEVCEGYEADDGLGIAQIETMKEYGVAVPFHKGVFLLDYEDWLKYGHICFIQESKGYIVNDTGKGDTRKVWYLHREVMGNPEGLVVDHINGDKLDNRKYNLRACTVAENVRNQASSRGTSQYKGVSWSKEKGKWYASIGSNGVSKSLGRYDSEEDAAKAYDDSAKVLHGEYARLNFAPPYTKPFLQTCICSRDKDLRQIYGLSYSWECGAQPSWGPKLVEGFGELTATYYPEGHKLEGKLKKLSGTGDKWFLAQLLMGDGVDNIPGLKGCGPVKALELLKDTMNYEEGLQVVIDEYFCRYSAKFISPQADVDPMEELIQQAQLVWMVRERNEDGSLKMWSL